MPDQSPQYPYRLIAFDIGGVLIQICHTWEGAARVAGVKTRLDPDGVTSLISTPLLDAYQMDAISLEEYLSQLGEWLGCTPEEAERIHNGILLEEYPGVLDLVKELKALGIRTACLSNTNEPHWQEFSRGRFPAFTQLDLKMASHVVRINKPERRIFELLAETAGVQPSEIVYFDDHPVNAEAAAEVGLRTLRIDPHQDTAAQMRAFLTQLGILPG